MRIAGLCAPAFLVSWGAVYMGCIGAIASYQEAILIRTSLASGHSDTALEAFLLGLQNLYTSEPASVALHIALASIAFNVALGGVYAARRSSLSGPLRASIGASVIFFLGLGCLSCGAFFGLVLSSFVAASVLPALLAIGGPALLWGGTAALVGLSLVLAKKATDPLVC